MRVLDRNQFPPRGWEFYQPETGWSLPTPLNHSFDSAVALIAAHRRANPVLAEVSSLAKCAEDLEAYTRARLGMNRPDGEVFRYEAPPVTKSCRTCG